MPIEDCPPRAPLENPPPDPRALANERVGAPMSEAMRKTAMRCERVTMTFPFTRRMGLLIETGSILTGLCEENLINHCGDSHGERGMIRITSYKMCWAEIRAGSTRRRGGSVEFGHDGEYQRGKVPVSHADRFGMCTS